MCRGLTWLTGTLQSQLRDLPGGPLPTPSQGCLRLQAFGPGRARWVQSQSLELESYLPHETPQDPLFSPQRGRFQTHTSRPGCFSGHCPRARGHAHNSCSPSSTPCPASPSWKVPGDRCVSVHPRCWLLVQRDREWPARHWRLPPFSSLGEVALEQAGSVLTVCWGRSVFCDSWGHGAVGGTQVPICLPVGRGRPGQLPSCGQAGWFGKVGGCQIQQ